MVDETGSGGTEETGATSGPDGPIEPGGSVPPPEPAKPGEPVRKAGFRWQALFAGILGGGVAGYLLIRQPDILVLAALLFAAFSQQRMVRQPQVALSASRPLIYLQGAIFLTILGAITVVALTLPGARTLVIPADGGVAREALIGLAIGVGAALVITVWERLARIEETALTRHMIPQTSREKALFALLSLAAGVGEELAFRGFLIDRLGAWTGLPPLAMLVSSLLFGLSHSYQGWSGVVRTGAVGLALALLVWWRGDLLAAMVAHFVFDVVAGLYFAHRDVPG